MQMLSTGRIVAESKMANGATHAEIQGGGEMTESEWMEYCDIISAMTSEQRIERLNQREQ